MAISNFTFKIERCSSAEANRTIVSNGVKYFSRTVDCLARILVMREDGRSTDLQNYYGSVNELIINSGSTITANETNNPSKFRELFGEGITYTLNGWSSDFNLGGKLTNTYLGVKYLFNALDKSKSLLTDDTDPTHSPLIVSRNVYNVIGGFNSKGCIDLSNSSRDEIYFNDQGIGAQCSQTIAPLSGYADVHSNINKSDVIYLINKVLEHDSPYYYTRLKDNIKYTGTLDLNSAMLQLYVNVEDEVRFGHPKSTDLVHAVYQFIDDVTGQIIPIPQGMKRGNETYYKIYIRAYDKDFITPIRQELLLEFPHTTNKMKLHGLPLLSLISNTQVYKDYINKINQTTTNFKYEIYLESFNRFWYITFGPVLTPNQAYDDTFLGSTDTYELDARDFIQFNATIPLSQSSATGNILTHTLSTTKETLELQYINVLPRDNTPDLGDPIDQLPTPTEPPYNIEIPITVDINNHIYYPDLPIGTVIDSMDKQKIETTINPLLSVNALYTIYKIDVLDIPKLAHFLFDTDWYENLQQINNNPLEHILSFKVSAFDLDSDRREQVKLVNIPVEYTPPLQAKVIVEGDVIERNTIYTIGRTRIKGKYNNFMDLTMTQYQLYLPFVGFVDLDPNLCLNYWLELKVYVDSLTLLAKYQLVRPELPLDELAGAPQGDNLLLGEWEFNSAYDLPLSASNKAQAEFSIIGNIAKTLVSVGTAIAMPTAGSISNAVSSGVGGVFDAMLTQNHTTTQGSPSANLSLLTSRQAFLKISRPMWQDLIEFNHTHGRKLNSTRYLGRVKGFTKIAPNTDLDGLGIVGVELQLLKEQLQRGVVF